MGQKGSEAQPVGARHGLDEAHKKIAGQERYGTHRYIAGQAMPEAQALCASHEAFEAQGEYAGLENMKPTDILRAVQRLNPHKLYAGHGWGEAHQNFAGGALT